jgi:hypothetical protein
MCVVLIEFIARLVFLSVHLFSFHRRQVLIRLSWTQIRRQCAEPRGRDYVVVNLLIIRGRKQKGMGAAHMWDDLRILLVANDVECRIVDSYKVANVVSATAGSTRIMIWQSTPFVRALDILDMATPTEAAYSGGSSETLEQ